MLEEQHQEVLVELEGAGELVQDLPDAVQEEEEDRSFPAWLAVGERRLDTALLEGVASLWDGMGGIEEGRGDRGEGWRRDKEIKREGHERDRGVEGQKRGSDEG